MRGRGRGRGRARGRRGGGMSRARPKKKVIESDEDENQMDLMIEHHDENNFAPVKIDMEADISQLEAPTFTTLNRGPPEPMLRLRWDHRVSLIGEKVLNPMIHCCDKCLKPILIYGRMIPCKHVFCLQCGREEEKACPRCQEPVTRVEQTGLGTVFMCTHGGTRYGHSGCRRTYLSQRDLQAHINHRHTSVGDDPGPPAAIVKTIVTSQEPRPRKIPQAATQNDPRGESSSMQYRNQSQRSNLITVPIQEEQSTPTPPQPSQIPPHYHQSGPSSGAPPPPMYGSGPSPSTPAPPPPSYYSNAPPPPGFYPPPPYTTPPPPPQYQDPAAGYWPHPPPPIQQFYR